jgi:hypothetical protein
MEPFIKYDSTRKGVWFSLEIQHEEYLALISSDALNVHFHASKKECDQLTAYKKNRIAIDQVAYRKFANDAFRPIRLSVADF